MQSITQIREKRHRRMAMKVQSQLPIQLRLNGEDEEVSILRQKECQVQSHELNRREIIKKMFNREKPKTSLLKRAKPHKGEVKQQICNLEGIIKACKVENSKSSTSAEKKIANERQIKLCTRAIAKLKGIKNKKLT